MARLRNDQLGILAGPYCDGGPFTEYRAWSGRGYFGRSVKPQTPHATLPNEQCGTGTHLGELHFGWAYRSILASLFRRSQWPDCRHSTTGSHVADSNSRLKAANCESRHFNVDQCTCRAICGTPYGRILAFGEASHAFLAAAALYGLMIVVLPFLRIGGKSRNLTEWKGFRHEFSIGVRFTTLHQAGDPVIWSFLLLSVFGRPIFELLPGLADDIFGKGANGFSWLAGAVGAGTIAAFLWIAHRPDSRCTFATIIGHILLFGAATLALSVAPNFWIAVGLATIATFTSPPRRSEPWQ